MATNFLELATTLTYLGANWLPEKKVNFTPCHVFVLDETAGIIIFVLFSYWCRITINNMDIVYLFNDTLHVHVHVLVCEDIRTFSMSLLDCGIVFL